MHVKVKGNISIIPNSVHIKADGMKPVSYDRVVPVVNGLVAKHGYYICIGRISVDAGKVKCGFVMPEAYTQACYGTDAEGNTNP